MSLVQFSKNTDEWGTPDHIFALAERWWGPHTMDVAATQENTKVPTRWSDDSLNIPWSHNNWCNPPFSLITDFVEKAIHQRDTYQFATTMICKAAPETKWFALIRKYANEITFLAPRVHYIGAGKSAPFPSCFVRFDVGAKGIVQWYNFHTQEYY